VDAKTVYPVFISMSLSTTATVVRHSRERQCADTTGTVLVHGLPFPMLKYKYIFRIKYTEAILSNSTRKLLWLEISKMLIGFKNELLCYLS